MDWKLAIRKNRSALAIAVAGLIAIAGQDRTAVLCRPGYRAILNILRPAEAALRRLIVIVAAVMKVRAAAKAVSAARPLPDFAGFGPGNAIPAFPLIDPRRTFLPDKRWTEFEHSAPRISVPGLIDPLDAAPANGHEVDPAAIKRRIAALDHALKTLPRQAKRLARLMERRSNARPGSGRVGPVRPGLPPGYRQRSVHPVDAILKECHFLVRDLDFRPP